MKKTVKIFGVIFTSLLLLGLTACNNWMTGNLFSSIEKEIEVASAENKDVYVRYADTSFGEINAKSDYAKYDEKEKTFPAKIEHSFTVSATPGTSYAFVKWAAFSSLDVNPKKNLTSLIFDSGDESYELNYLPKELPAEIVSFENIEISDDGESSTAECKIIVSLEDEKALIDREERLKKENPEKYIGLNLRQYYNPDARIYVMPVVAKRAELSRYTYPRNESETVYVRNQRVALAFKKNMDFGSFVQLKEEYKEFTDQGIYFRTNEDGTKEYFYDWDRDLIKIVVNDSNGNPVDEDAAYAYFSLPEPDSDDPKKIVISPNLENKLPKYAEIIITISKYVKDSDGFYLTTAIEYTYSVGQFEDNGAPTFILLSGGVPDVVDSDNFADQKDRENSWSDFNGYADKDGSVTNQIPDDSTNVDDWENDEINTPFSNRISNSIDMLVKIVDQIKPGELNNNATDQDIKSFAVRARHLVHADGTPGTGKLYETDQSYNFDSLRYSNGSKGFEVDEPGNKYKTPEDGYAFPFYLPEDIPDGLIKIEVYAVDVTGNSGESEPFAIYVVKDTQAPALENQADRILSASTNTLTNWFNATTIQKLAFRVDATNPIVDTTIIEGEIRDVHSKFMNSDAKLYWKFGSSEDQMGSYQETDNTGNISYDMSQLISAIKDQGAMTFYSQIRDNMGNKSKITQIPLKIYFDTVEPEEAEIIAPGEGSKIYPYASGVTGGSSGTYYTKDSELKLNLMATDSDFAGTTETSSGVAGFLVPETEYSAEALAEALTIEDGKLKDMVPAAEGKVEQTFAAGATPNDSKQDHYIYTVDNALNASKKYTKISVIQDTTGPGIILSDEASYTYNKNTNLYKAKAELEEWECAPGEKGSVKGFSKGNYYYNASETDFPFAVTLKNECGEFDSGAFMFSVRKNNKDGAEVASGSTLGDITLSEGSYVIVAYDNLGNETVSPLFAVVQDTTAPVLNSSAFKIHGRKFGLSEYNTVTTNYRTVHLSFDAKDIEGKNTGIRKLILKGASFKGSESAPIIVKAGETTLTAGTDYFIEAAEIEEDESYIIFVEPRLETSFRVENAVLPASDGTKVVTLAVTDAVGNTCSQIETSIFADTNAPTVTSVCDIALAPSIDGTEDIVTATNIDKVNVQISAYDAISGLRKIYIVDALSKVDVDKHDVPEGTSLLTAESKLFADGVELQGTVAAGNAYFELAEPSISTTDVLYTVTNVTLPELSRQGVQTIHVVVYDDTGLRPQTSVSDSIVYDTTGPAIRFTDYASYKYNGDSLKKYRKNDTANDVAAVTGNTGTVNGLVTGTYYYNNDETYFTFKVDIEDQNVTNNTVVSGGIVSGEYRFFIDSDESTLYNSGDEILLAAGSHTVTALDKLGNRTVSPAINVVQDTSAPSVSDIVIHGTEADGSTESTAATTSDTVYVTFKVNDTETVSSSNTGVRKLFFKGADFSAFAIKAGSENLVKNTDYFTSTEGEYTVVTFTVPDVAETEYTATNVKLVGTEGTKRISIYASDATENAGEESSNTIFFDSSAPAVTEVTMISPDVDVTDESKETSTKTPVVTVRINVSETVSGIRRIYINKAAASSSSSCEFPVSDTLLSAESVVKTSDGTVLGTYNAGIKAILFAEPYLTESAESQVLYVTNVNIPETDRQGTQEIFVSVYDNSGLRERSATADTIIYDTTGPAITISDFAANALSNAAVKKYRSNDTADDVAAVTGTTGSVNGLVTGTYYYNNDETYFVFKVDLNDKNITNNAVVAAGTSSGAYRFFIDSDETVLYQSGDEIHLAAGTHTVTALDNLGNRTVSPEIRVLQDTKNPVVNNVVLHGTEADGTTESTTATISDTIYVTFNVNDTISSDVKNTGIRKIALKGADFAASVVKAGENTLVKNTDYFTTTEGDYYVITFVVPDYESTDYTISNVILSELDGNKVISVNVSDSVLNLSQEKSASIFFDGGAPEVRSLTLVSSDSDESDESRTTSTKTTTVNARIEIHELVSGIKRIYVNFSPASADSSSSFPESRTLLSLNSKVLNSAGNELGSYNASLGAVILNEPYVTPTAADEIITVTNINLPEPERQGTQTVYVSVFDDSGLRNTVASSDSIIYDTTGPAVVFEDYASYEYGGSSLKKYRSNDIAENIAAVTGTTGSVDGLVSGTYYYSNSEPYFVFTVNLSDKNITGNAVVTDGTSSGAYRFFVDDASTVLYESGDDIHLTTGNHTVTALDNLGNRTVSPVIHVIQDTVLPGVSNLVVHGTEADGVTESTSATTSDTVYVTFDVNDTITSTASNNTGIRKIHLKGADFSGLSIKAGETELTQNTDYFVTEVNGYTVLTFKVPDFNATHYTVSNVKLAGLAGTKTISVNVSDSTENTASADLSYSIFFDDAAPAVASVTMVSIDADESDVNKETSTKTSTVEVRLSVTETVSGIKRIYINKAAASAGSRSTAPTSDTLLSATSKVKTLSGIVLGNYDTVTESILFTTPYITTDEASRTLVVTGVNIPETDRQGTQEIFVSVFDDSGLRNEQASSDTIIYDTTGPAVTFRDYAANVLTSSLVKKYRSTDDEKNVSAVTGTTGSVTGLAGDSTVFGTYYYSLGEEGFNFKVDLSDKNITNNVLNESGTVSGAFKFYIDQADSVLKENGSTVCLSTGNHTITAFDNLRNTTVITPIRVVQDTGKPVVSNLVVTGTEADGTTESVYAVTSRTVTVDFNVDDTISTNAANTGVRRIVLKGADFSGMVLKRESSELTLGTDYFVSSDGDYTVITFAVTDKNASAYSIENVQLAGNEGTKTISVNAYDGTGNCQDSDSSYSIFYDGTAPAVTEVAMISSDADTSDAAGETSTKTSKVSVRVKAWDVTSGIRRIYVNSAAADSTSRYLAPASTSLLSADSVVKAGTETVGTYNATYGAILVSNPIICALSNQAELIITNVNLPETTRQGTQEIFVSVYDNSGLRNQTATSDTIIYDTTGPAIDVESYSSNVYDGITLKKYVSNNTASDKTAVTGTTGRVNGLVTGNYFYSIAEGARAANKGYKFTVTLTDENITNNVHNASGAVSGVYKFYIDTVTESGVTQGTTAYSSGSDVYITEGTYRIRGVDNLGNSTSTNNILVKKDNAEPVSVTDLEVTGTLKDTATASTRSTHVNGVKATFTAGDDEAGKINTGILKMTLSGDADFTNATLSVVSSSGAGVTVTPLVLKAEGVDNWDYTVTAASGTVSFFFREPVTARRTYQVDGIVLSNSDAQKNFTVNLTDFTENQTAADGTASIFRDVTAPVVSDVLIISTDEDKLHSDDKTTVTNDILVTVDFLAKDVLSGIKYIYVNDSADKDESAVTVPTGHTLLTAESVLSKVTTAENGDEVVTAVTGVSFNSVQGRFEMASGSEIISSESEKFRITNVMIPRSDYADAASQTEGTNTVYVVAYDDVLNRNETAAADSIVFDRTPPVQKINMHASNHFGINPNFTQYNGVTYVQYMDDSDPDNIVYYTNQSSKYLVTVDAEDPLAGFWKSSYKASGSDAETDINASEPGAEKTLTLTPSSSGNSYDIITRDAIGTTSQSSVKVVYDGTAPTASLIGFFETDGVTPLVRYLTSGGSDRDSYHNYYTNKDAFTVKFKVNDALSGISYFDVYGTSKFMYRADGNDWSKNGPFDDLLYMSKDFELVIDGNIYTRISYNRQTGEYSDGPSGFADSGTYESATGKFKDKNGNYTEYVYFNTYFNIGDSIVDPCYRSFGLYNKLSAGADHTVELKNIKLKDALAQSYMKFDIYPYDAVRNSSSDSGNCISKYINYDTTAPSVENVYFKTSNDPNFVSDALLSSHDLVIEFKENRKTSESYDASGIEYLDLELTTNSGADLSSVNLKNSSDFAVYIGTSDTTTNLMNNTYSQSSNSATSDASKLHFRFFGDGLDRSSSSWGWCEYYSRPGTDSAYIVIKNLTINGGSADQVESIKVTLTDRAGNVSDNTGNTHNIVSIGYDQSAPSMYPMTYCDDDGNVVTIEGRPAVSYFKTFLGNPVPLSTHTSTSRYMPTSVSQNICVLPNPGEAKKGTGEDHGVWDAGADTELVLKFNKNGSGIKKIKLHPTCAYRGIFFNSSTISVSIANGNEDPVLLTKGVDYNVGDLYTGSLYQSIVFTSSSKCPRGNNAAVYIKGVVLDYAQAAASETYGLWCARAELTSFANKTKTYLGDDEGWQILAGLDFDTPEFTRQKVTYTDSTITSKASVTDGKNITMTGRIQSRSADGTFSSGLWAIHLDNAKFTSESEFNIEVFNTTTTIANEVNPNAITTGTVLNYTYEAGKDFSKRFIPGDKLADCEVAEFNRSLTATGARYSLSDDGHTMYLNIPLDPQDGTNFTITKLQLDGTGIDITHNAGTSDGPINITATLIKYSGLTNDDTNRIYVKDAKKNLKAPGESYTVSRRSGAIYSSSLTDTDSSKFATNRINSITLDTVDPVIKWNGISNDSKYCHSYKDSESGIVYYPNNSNVRVAFSMTDAGGSGIYGYLFDTNPEGATTSGSYTKGSPSVKALNDFNAKNESSSYIRYLHIIDNVGHVVSRPVTYESDSENSNPTGPTYWKLDNTSPAIKTGVLRHYYGNTPESRFVLKQFGTYSYYVYHNASTSTVTGSFNDTPVSGETGGADQFFTDSGSGIYGIGTSSSTYYANLRTEYSWSTAESNYIYDGVGNYQALSWSKKEDAGKPELSFYSIYSNKGGNSFWPKSSITLSTSEKNPTVLYLNGKEDADYIRLVLNAKDTGDNATGIYKVTANGTELPVGAAYDNTVSHLSGRTEFSTDPTTVTWLLGAGEAKSEGGNGLLRSITVTDWVGNENTYWFQLVSDTTAPVLDLSGNGPFAATTPGQTYTISNPTSDSVAKTGKPLLFFSPSTWVNNNKTTSVTVNLSAAALSDTTSGLNNAGQWYSNEACTNAVTQVSFVQNRAWQINTWVYETPQASIPTIYTKDNVGNTYSITFVGATTDNIDEVSAADGKVIFCYASANTAANIDLQTGQIVMDETSYAESGTVGLSSGAARKVYITGSSTTVKFAPEDYNGLSYQYKVGDGEYNAGTRFSRSQKITVASITMDAGKTYTVKLYSTKASSIYTEYSFEIIQDASAPSLAFYSSAASTGLTYPSSVTLSTSKESPAVLYLKGTEKDDYHSIVLKATDTGSVGVKSAEAGGTGIVKVTTEGKETVTSGTATVNATDEMEITFRLGSGENKNEGTANGLLRSLTVTDWLGNASTYWFKLVSDNTAPVYTAAAYDLLSAHAYAAAEEPSPYVVNSNNAVYIRNTATVTLPDLSDGITGVNGNGWTLTSGSGASLSGRNLTVTEAGTVALSYQDNVGNTVNKEITVKVISTSPSLALADSGYIGTDDYTESTWGSGTYTVYTKASDGKARLKLSPQNIISSFTTYSYAGTGSVSGVTGTVSEGSEIQLPAGTYTFTATDLFNQTAEYTVTVIADTEGPSVGSDIIVNATYTAGDDYYCTGASNTEKTAYTFYTKGTDEITVDLSALSGLSDSGSGFRGWSESGTAYTAITSVTLPAGSGAVKTIYMWDKVGNTTAVTFTGTRCDSVSLTVTPASGTGIYYDSSAEKIYTNLASVNATVSASGSSPLTYSSNVTEGTATLAAGEEGVAVPYTITVSDVVGNTDSKTLNVIKDSEKPNPDSLVFTITKNATSSNGENDESIKSYFDNSDSNNWKLYYNTTQKFYPFFTITGITDALSGPANIGLNSTTNKPGSNFMNVANGEATNVWGSFTGTMDKALYISDKVGNGAEDGNYFKVIHGIADTTGPASVSISGDDAVYFQKIDKTYVYNGLGTLSGTDSESGIDTVVVSGNRIVATDKVGNTSDFGEVDSSLGKINSFDYTSDSGRDAAIASEADSDWSDTWAHRYKFTVSGYSAITKIYVLGVDSKDFGCNKLYVGTSQVNLSKTASEYSDNKWLIEINVQNANNLSGDVAVKLYSGYGNCTPANVSIFVAGTKTSAVNPSITSRFGTAIIRTGANITSTVARTVRQIFIPENRDVTAGSKKSEDSSVKNRGVEAVSETVSSVAAKTSDITVKKAKRDLEKRAAEIEASGKYGTAAGKLVEETAAAVKELVEETEMSEIDGIQPEMGISENVVKQENFVDKSAVEGYNNNDNAKSVGIFIISALLLLCSIFVIIQYNKRRNK